MFFRDGGLLFGGSLFLVYGKWLRVVGIEGFGEVFFREFVGLVVIFVYFMKAFLVILVLSEMLRVEVGF